MKYLISVKSLRDRIWNHRVLYQSYRFQLCLNSPMAWSCDAPLWFWVDSALDKNVAMSYTFRTIHDQDRQIKYTGLKKRHECCWFWVGCSSILLQYRLAWAQSVDVHPMSSCVNQQQLYRICISMFQLCIEGLKTCILTSSVWLDPVT